jgi:Flp pilus assembly protein TadD
MQPADSSTVLGNFENADFAHEGVSSRFFRRGSKFFVRTDGPDGALADFEIRYTFGVAPLQQYLIELPGGRVQALSIAWDSRPSREGGQRWFHLYPNERIAHGDELHWTGPQQNWNFMCADCHSTNLRRNYDAASRAYHTTWSEIDVSCETCHGPGGEHVAWAKRSGLGRLFRRPDPSMGLTATFRERRTMGWTIDAATGNARAERTGPLTAEIETCAPCHSRRATVADGFMAGDRFLDHYQPSLLEPPLYYPDGQQRDEVYVWGSFVQSRMYHAGVTCSDCHDPHSGRLRASGNGLCASCHLPAKYDAAAHHHHEPGKAGSSCVECHMPETTYMVIDKRADHSLRVPRPDLTESIGMPNACGSCHGDRPARWAADQISRWTGREPGGFQRYASALAAASSGGGSGGPSDAMLAAVLADTTQPEIARATAARAITAAPGTVGQTAARSALADPSALVRAATLSAVERLPLPDQVRLVPPLLEDPVRIVRLEAARILASVPGSALTPPQQAAFDRAAAEYEAAQRIHADRPEHRTNLGTFYAQRGRRREAETEFRAAIDLLPRYAPAYVNFADMRRAEGRDGEAEALLRQGLRAAPEDASLRHSLGLTLVRMGRIEEAMPELSRATRLSPEDSRFAYVYAVALQSSRHTTEALKEIDRALVHVPGDVDLLGAAVAFSREMGEDSRARKYAERLEVAAPGNPLSRQTLRRTH